MKNNLFKRFIGMIVSTIFASLGISLIMKASLGLAPNDALTMTVSNVSGLKVGNVSMIINTFFILSQIIILGKKFEKTQYFQFVSALIVGFIINIFYYEILRFNLDNYLIKIIVFLIGTVVLAASVASIMVIDFSYSPLEGFINMITEKTNGNFVKYRFYYDIFGVLICLILSLVFKSEILIREGTLISLLLFSPIMGIFIKAFEPIYKLLNLTTDTL